MKQITNNKRSPSHKLHPFLACQVEDMITSPSFEETAYVFNFS